MEHAACNVVYVNRRAKDQIVHRGSIPGAVSVTLSNGSDIADSKSDTEINSTIESILSAFTTGMTLSFSLLMAFLTQQFTSFLLDHRVWLRSQIWIMSQETMRQL
jgi:hypothetical protein